VVVFFTRQVDALADRAIWSEIYDV
jgi:hypothetical protein